MAAVRSRGRKTGDGGVSEYTVVQIRLHPTREQAELIAEKCHEAVKKGVRK